MKIVLINPYPDGKGINEATIEPPLGLAYIASILEKNGFECYIIDANALKISKNEIINRIPPDVKLIGIYLNSFCFSIVQELCTMLRNTFPSAQITLGGPLPTSASEMVLSEFSCDGLIRGEGEYAMLRICQNMRDGKIPFDSDVSGAYYHDCENRTIISNPPVRIKDLDQLPFPAYHLLPNLSVYKTRSRKNPVAAMITSRGCPFSCTFCSKDVFQRQVTFRSAENVLKEIDYLIKKFGVRQIDILDDNFTLNRPRVDKILDGIILKKYNIAINLQSGIRCENIDEPLLLKMKQAGVYKIAFGIESADPNVLKLVKKDLNLTQLENVISLARRLNFVIYGFFIIGLPGESEEGFQKTMEFAKRLDLDIANFSIAIPFIGTELYDMVNKGGRILIDTTRNIDTGFYGKNVFFECGKNKADDIVRRFDRAYYEYYDTKRKIKLILKIRSWGEIKWLIDAAFQIIKK